jgi:hypothetical protein
MSDDQTIPAGWYPDPEFQGEQRFWDGSAWTDNRQPIPAPAAPPPPPGLGAAPPLPMRTARPGEKSNAGMALAFSILGIVFCQILAPVGMIMGRNEVSRIDAGRGDPGARGLAQGAYVVGLIGTIIVVALILFLVVFLAILAVGSSA